MAVIIHHGLSDMQRRLTHQVLEFLPPAVSGNLHPLISISIVPGTVQSLTPWRNTTNSSSDLRVLGPCPFSRPSSGMAAGNASNGYLPFSWTRHGSIRCAAEWRSGVFVAEGVRVQEPERCEAVGSNLPGQGWFGWVCNWRIVCTRLQACTV